MIDYVSPGLGRVDPSEAFSDLGREPPGRSASFSDGSVRIDPHCWFHDRHSATGFVNVDEAHLLCANARQFADHQRRNTQSSTWFSLSAQAIEVGCAAGYSSWHILTAGLRLAICDPALAGEAEHLTLNRRLHEFGDRFATTMIPSPVGVLNLGRYWSPWSFAFIDGNHDAPYPRLDAVAVEHHADVDAMIMFHDCIAPAPVEAMDLLASRGWNVGVYNTFTLMGVAWRGTAKPVHHIPDPAILEQPLPLYFREGGPLAGWMFS